MGPESGPVGTVFQIALAGFRPNDQVPLRLYRYIGGGSYAFVTSLGPVQIGERGTAIYPLPTQLDDPPGVYAVTTNEPTEKAIFDVTPQR